MDTSASPQEMARRRYLLDHWGDSKFCFKIVNDESIWMEGWKHCIEMAYGRTDLYGIDKSKYPSISKSDFIKMLSVFLDKPLNDIKEECGYNINKIMNCMAENNVGIRANPFSFITKEHPHYVKNKTVDCPGCGESNQVCGQEILCGECGRRLKLSHAFFYQESEENK